MQPEPFRIPATAVPRYLRGVIGSEIQMGVLSDIELAKQSGTQTELFLLIDSPGGSPKIGIELYEKLTEACNNGVLALTTCNIKRTDSSAVCIYCAGQTRWCDEQASFLLHEAAFDPMLGYRCTASKIANQLIPQLTNEIPNLERLTARFVEIIASATGKPQQDVSKMLAEETTERWTHAIRDGLSHRVGITKLVKLEDIKTYGREYDNLL